jgi:hypothetical protein
MIVRAAVADANRLIRALITLAHVGAGSRSSSGDTVVLPS